MKFLVKIIVQLPHGMPDTERNDLFARERERGRQLAESGTLCAIWRIPGQVANWSVYEAVDADAVHETLTSLPLFPWLTATVEPLATHPVGTTHTHVTPMRNGHA